jgi:muramoyltetrapeptide carboxypeptidase
MKSKPAFLRPGDEIRIISPASVVEKEYIKKTTRSIENLGYKVTWGKHTFAALHQFAGRDKKRINDAQQALDEKDIKAVFCARGGYGSIRIIDKLDFSSFIQNPKWIVGFSDITVFHSLLNCQYNIPSIHSPMPVNYGSPSFNQNLNQLNDLLQGRLNDIQFESNSLNRSGKVTGKLVGGNLSILYSLQSTPYQIETKDNILFIEDVGEQLYHLDRMLNNFRLSGKLDKIKGLIVGGLTEMKDKKRPFGKSAEEIVFSAAEKYHYPIAFNFPAGHTQNNVPFLLGTEIELKVENNSTSIRYI